MSNKVLFKRGTLANLVTMAGIGGLNAGEIYLVTDKQRLAVGLSTTTFGIGTDDSVLLSRANHTGTQSADTIVDGTTNKAYTATEQTKLSGIAAGATNYSHPVNHPPSIITQDTSNRFVTDAQITTWNSKQDSLAASTGIGIGTAAVAGTIVKIGYNLTGATTAVGVNIPSVVQTDVTAGAVGYRTSISTVAASFTLPSLTHYQVNQGTIGAGSTVTAQYGFSVGATMSGATNNYGFYGGLAAATNNYNLYMTGTADNFLAGKTGIGGAAQLGETLRLGKTITGATTAVALYNVGVIQSDITAAAYYYRTFTSTVAASFTLPSLVHYGTAQSTIGSGSVVTSQIGFEANSTLIGATNNYGFYGNIPAGTGRYNLYMLGTAQNVFNGDVLVTGSAASVGYGTGSGGTATQATSRTTAVTLNKATGSITLFSAAGSTTATSFTVNNSLVGINDTIQICQRSGANKYITLITAVAAGSFVITFYTTGGTTTEAPVFNFTVLKGAVA